MQHEREFAVPVFLQNAKESFISFSDYAKYGTSAASHRPAELAKMRCMHVIYILENILSQQGNDHAHGIKRSYSNHSYYLS